MRNLTISSRVLFIITITCSIFILIEHLACRVCQDAGLNHTEFKLLDEKDRKKIFVFAKGITGVQDEVSRIAERFEGFSVFTREMKEVDGVPMGVYEPLVDNADAVRNYPRMPFKSKSWEQVSADGKKPVNVSKCELIVRGEDLLRVGEAVGYTEYYAVISAHSVLSEEQCVRLINADPDEFRKVWNELCSPTRNITYSLEDHQGNHIDVVGLPIFRYWHYASCEYQRRGENNTTDTFLNDTLLFKLDSSQLEKYGWLDDDPKTGLCKLEVHTSKFSLGHPVKRYHEAQIKGIVPIEKPADFARFNGRRKLRVMVNNKIGHLYDPDVRLKGQQYLGKWRFGHNFHLILEDGKK